MRLNSPSHAYNQGIVKSRIAVVFTLLLAAPLFSQSAPTAGHTIAVVPFENTSPTPGLEWIGEAFPELIHDQLNSPVLYVANREERLRAYDRLGIPVGVHPSRATLYKIAEQMDVDFVVLGSYSYDGSQLNETAQLLDMRASKLFPPVIESGRLQDFAHVEAALEWDLLHLIRSDFSVSKERYVQNAPALPLDGIENRVRGILATSPDEQIHFLKEATRLDPSDFVAWLDLGKAYLNQRSYDSALNTFSKVPANSAIAREANVYLGIASYFRGDAARAEAAFAFVAERVPLAGVYNNLGVIESRRGRKAAIADLQKAAADDPGDPDYRFNLALAYDRFGDNVSAVRELHVVLEGHPGDSEARSALESLSSNAGTQAVLRQGDRIKRDYEEDTFRQMTIQMRSWAEQRFARSEPKAHARYHVETGRELLTHAFNTEAEAEFREAATLDSSSTAAVTGLAEVYEARGDAQAARAQAEASLRIRESAEAYVVLARLDLRENRTDTAAWNLNRAAQLEPGNRALPELKRAIAAAKFSEKSQP